MAEHFAAYLEQMQQRYEKLAGIQADDASDIGIRFKILAEQLAGLNRQLEEVQAQSFLQTAGGEALEQHAVQRGIRRKAATYAKGEVIFSRSTAAEDIFIPAGVSLTGSGQLRYLTTKDILLPQGQSQAAAPIQCQTAGSGGNLAAGILNVMITPVPGISSVTNPQPITSGEDAESDESLRQRLLDSYQQTTNGTNSAFYYNQAMSYAGVRSVKVLPRVNGIGTVGIIVHGPGVDAELLAQMTAEIGLIKEINVGLTIEPAVEKAVALSVQIAAADGYSFADIKENCGAALGNYINGLKIGQPLYPAMLVRELLNCRGVANCQVLSPAADLYPLEKEILILGSADIAEMERQRGGMAH